MYIQPNSVVKLLRNVPLDTTYNHTLYFTSKEAQANYFAGQTKYSFSNVSYSRASRGSIRLEISADSIYDCNYMMFQNSSYGNRWFYAFITEVEYINDATAQVNFVLDVMQTWHFDYELKQCFVEREHAADDRIGANLAPENLDCGEFVVEQYISPGDIYDYFSVVIAFSEFSSIVVPALPYIRTLTPHYYTGTYQGLNFVYFPIDQASMNELKDWISKLDATTADGILSIFMCPTWQIPTTDNVVTNKYNKVKNLTAFSRFEGDFDGYTPKNKKVYTYPYSFLEITNFRGQSSDLRYELFSSPKEIVLQMQGNFSTQPATALIPINYAGANSALEQRVTINTYPQCSWIGANFIDWLAANTLKESASLGIGAAIAGVQYAVGDVAGATATAGSLVAEAFSALRGIPETPSGKAKGASPGDLLAGETQAKSFGIYKMRITGDYAKRIDEFFTMYGYATNRVKVPNRSARPRWNYVKTSGCVVTGSVPADDMRAICGIYDRGITFWKRGTEVGNYSLSNK